MALGAAVFELEGGEHVLMVRGVEGFLVCVDIYGRVLMPYCSVIDSGELTPESAGELHYHQRGEPLVKHAWVWLPRVTEGAPTSYHVRKQAGDRSLEWFVQRVLPLKDIPLTAKDDGELVADLAARMTADFNEQIAALRECVRGD